VNAAPAQKLDGLEAFRGLAALLVLLHHAFGTVSLPQNFNTVFLGGIFEEGDMGVNLFFVISGFVIAWSNPRDGRRPREVLIYVLRRIARIYPMYWVACLLVLPVYWKFAPAAIGELTPGRLFHDALLLPWPQTPMLGVAWTLIYEMMFYLLFVPMLLNRRAGLMLWAALTAGILTALAVQWQPENVWLTHLISPYVLEFLAGMAVCLWIRRHPLTPRTAAALVRAGMLLLTAGVLLNYAGMLNWVPANLHYALGAAILIMGLVSLPASAGDGRRAGFRALQILGRYSFSIYLLHMAVQQTTVRLAVKFWGGTPGQFTVIAVLLTAIAASLAAGIMAGRLLEMPMLEWCKRRIARLKTQAPAAVPVSSP